MDVVDIFLEMSLATLQPSGKSFGETGIVLHDLQLDFCQRHAAEVNKSLFWTPSS